MAINIIDNFDVSVSKPIDNRFVVGSQSFYTNRDSIPYKYQGLRIWDLNNNIPYVWTGATWSNETASGTVVGSGTTGRIVKFVGSTPTSQIADSVIFESGGNVAIDTTSFGSPVAKLQVNGNIRAAGSGVFYGNGSQITNINASNISTGALNIARLQNGLSNQVLLSGISSPIWTNLSSVSVGNATNAINATTATNANNVNISSNNTNTTNYVTFVSSTGNQQVKINTTNSIRINPSNGNIGIGGAPQPYKLYVNGGVSIGSTTNPPTDGLRVQGDVVLVGNSSISTTSIHLDFEGPTSGTGDVNIRFFRATNTTGGKNVSFHRGNGTFQEDAKIGVGLESTFFGRGGGNIILAEHNSSSCVYIGSGANTGENGVLQVTSKNYFGNAIDGASFRAVNDTNNIINFVNTLGVNRGKIRGISSSAVAYDTSSDLRLKKDITSMGSMLEKIKMLNPSNYKWKSDDSKGFGFIAQEVYQVFPELRPTINSYCDTDCKEFDLDNPVDKNGNPYYYGLDYGLFTPFLTKALQEVIQNYEDLIDKIKNSDSLDDLKNSL